MKTTKGPWRQGIPPRESLNQIWGIDTEDGSRKLVAEVFGYTEEEIQANVAAILEVHYVRERLSTMRTPKPECIQVLSD